MTMSSRDGGRRQWRGFAFAAPLFVLFLLFVQASAYAQTFSIADVSFDEAAAPGAVTVTVLLDTNPGGTPTVDYSTANATAADGTDYTAASGTLSFAGGSVSETFTVTVLSDATDEVDETFVVNLTNAGGGGSIPTDPLQAAITILDDDGPDITVTDEQAAEGGDLLFVLEMNNTSPQIVTVDYTTADGDAVAGVDYTAAAGTLTFAAGTRFQTVTVTTLQDTTDEGVLGNVNAETFTLDLSSADNATLNGGATVSGVGQINDDDAPPTVAFLQDETAAETNSTQTVTETFTVQLSAASEKAITVTYEVNDGTATTAHADYTDTDGSLAFAAGVTSQTLNVVVNGDNTDENDETFTVDILTATTDLALDTDPTVTDAQAIGTITNDDSPPDITVATPTSVSDDGTNVTFTVSMSNPSAGAVTVDYATADGTATTADGDYTATSGTLTFAADNNADQTVTVLVGTDTKYESDETFTLALTNATGGVSGAATINGTTTQSATATITNTDSLPTLAIGNVTEAENADGSFDFTLTASNAADTAITVTYATTDGTATIADSDYTSTTGTATIAAGALTTTITVPVTGDLKNESDETFTLDLNNDAQIADATALTITDNSGLGTITNDDGLPVLSIADVVEVENADGTATFTVSMTSISDQAVTVNYATTDGTATTADLDYTSTSGTLTIAAGASSGTIDVPVGADTKNEDDETFTLTLTSPQLADATGLSFAVDGIATGTIDNDDNVVLAVAANSGAENGGAFTLTVSTVSSVTSDTDVTFTINTADGTGTLADSDYTQISGGTGTITAGSSSTTVTFTPTGDTTFEGDETVTISLTSAAGGADTGPTFQATGNAAGPATATATITNDDTAPTISVSDETDLEDTDANAVFTITLSAVSGIDATVAYTTTAGTATAGSDYTTTSGTATITAGSPNTTVNVPILSDALDEASETYTFDLSNPTNATILDAQGAGTITDDDPTPTIAIDDVASTEGTDSTAVYTLTLSAVSGQVVTANYAVTSGTATAGTDTGAATDDDGTAGDGIATFAVGDTTVVVTVPITDDTIDETVAAPETYTIALSGLVNATTTDTGNGTITDDDSAPTISITDVTANEDTGPFTFTVSLTNPSDAQITVDYATANNTATTGDGDYTAVTATTLTYAPGETSKSVTITVGADAKYEGTTPETFRVNLTNVTGVASVLDSQGIGTITDDDPAPSITIDDVTVTEAGTAVFTISLSAASGLTTTVDYATTDGTATTAGLDYSATLVDDDTTTGDGTATFTPGDTAVTVSVTTNSDTADEGGVADAETFTVDLTNATNGTITDASGTGTITDDDATPTISVDDVTVTEGDTDGSTTNAVFTITLSAASGNTVTVNYSVSDNTATTSDNDFSSTLVDNDATTGDGIATFVPATGDPATGPTTITVTVPVNQDTTDEADETYNLNLAGASFATISDAIGVGTITNDDSDPTISINDPVAVSEANVGGTTLDFTVSLSNPSSTAVSVDYATADGTATAGTDYTAVVATTLTFAAGETTKTVSVTAATDSVNEEDETVLVNLTNVVAGAPSAGASILDSQGVATISNDDTVSLSIAANSGAESGGTFTLTVTASNPTDTAIGFTVNTVDGTATTADSDYTAIVGGSGTIAGDSSSTTTTITITPTADTKNEADETLTVRLSSITGGADSAVTFATTADTVGPEDGVATITNDDDVAITVDDVTSTDETDGTITFTIDLGAGGLTSAGNVTVDYTTTDGTAKDGVGDSGTGVTDYTAAAGTATITAGSTSTTVAITFADDAINEANETFTLDLSNLTATLGSANAISDASGTATITDDDTPSLSIDDVTVTEAASATFTITTTNASDAALTVNYATGGTTATADTDFTTTTGTATIAAGDTTTTIAVPTLTDAVNEADETYSVFLTTQGGGQRGVVAIGDASGAGVINDDDDVLLSIDDVTVDEEAGTASFTVTASSPTDNAVTFNYASASGTATDGTDYTNVTATDGTIVGDSTDTTFPVTVTITDEATYETDETYTITLSNIAGGNDGAVNQVAVDTSNPGNASGNASVGTGTITNTDAAPVITVAAGSGTEAGNITFVVSIDKAPTAGLDSVVTYSVADDATPSALSGTDYSTTATDDDGNADNGTLTFTSAGAGADLTISVPSTADTIDEVDETFTLTLLGAGLANATFTGASTSDITAAGTITDDDVEPEIQIGDVTVLESAGTATLTININSGAGVATTASAKGITVDYVLSEVTATSATGQADYTAASAVDNDATTTDGIATFADESVTSVTVTVPIVDETTDENSETFAVTIGGVTLTNATLEDSNNIGNATSASVAAVTITDDDNTPTVTVGAVSAAESDGTMAFTITLSNASELSPSIDWRLTDVSTTSGSDYTATSGTAIVFAETELTKTATITLIDDTIDETASETFTFEVDRNDANLSGGSIGGYDVVASEPAGTITDDEAAPTITVSDKTYAEAAGATTYTGTEIFLSHGSDTDITVDYVVNDGSGSATFNAQDALGDGDYADTSGTLTFSAGTTVPAVDLAITINQDTKDENDEVFDIVFSNIAGGVAASVETFATDGTAAITITDDDAEPTVSVAPVTQAEAGGNAVFTATLTAISGKTVTMQVDTAAGDVNPATAGTDYTALTASTVTFGADTDLTKSFSVVVADDFIDEEDQEYKVVGSNFTNTSEAVAGDATAVGTITDDDAAPLVYVADVTQTETETSQTFDFSVALDNTANGGSNPGVSEKAITVDYATAAGTATAGSDYTETSGMATIAAASSSATVSVTVAGDTTDEADQTFTLTLSNPVNTTLDTNNDLLNASGADNIATGTITDNDAAPTISVDDITVLESAAGPASTTTGAFTVTLSEASELPVTVDVALSTTDATSGVDFAAAFTESDGGNDGTLNFAAGDLTETVTVTVNGDTTDEANQTFNVDLTNPTTTGSTPVISDAQGVATITDDDPAPSISINDITVLESAAGPSGTVPGTYAVTLDAASEQIVTVDFVAASGTTNGATAVSDFLATSGTVTFTAGDVSEAVAVTVNGDTTDEEDQTVEVTLSNPASASGDTPALAVSVGTLTITDDDPAPNVSVQDVTVAEGDSATTNLTLTVSLDAVSEKSATVDYAIVDVTTSTAGTLAAGGQDYSTTITESDADATAGTITFAAGDTSHTAIVAVNGDATDEGASETFTFTLSNPNANATLDTNNDLTNASGADNVATGTITDDDATPIITLADVTIPDEDNGGLLSQTFAPTLSNPSSSTVTANYTVAAGTASSTADFTAGAGTIQFTAGNTAADADIAVTLADDLVYEGDETFTVSLDTATNAVFSDTSDAVGPEVSTATITEDEALPTLSIDNVTVAEGDSGTATFTFTVTATSPATQAITVGHSVTDGTAVDAGAAGPADGTDDYDFTAGTVTIPGDGASTTGTITVTANGDTFFEADETFTVVLSGALLNGVTSLTITDASGLGTITNDDPAPTITVDDPTAAEATGSVVFTVTLSQAVGADVTVDYALADGSAVVADAGGGPEDGSLDYGAATDDDAAPADGTLTIEQGTTTATVTVVINDDSDIENDETFALNLTNPNGVTWTGYPTIATLQGLATITNDDNSSISIADRTITEGDSGTQNLVFIVTQSPANVADASVDYATANVTADSAGDYTAASGTLTFLAGVTTRTITVPIAGDTVDEGTGAETFTVTISNPSNTTLDGVTNTPANSSGSGNIATGTITDNDAQPTITIDDVTVTEGDSPTTTNATLTVTLSNGTEVGDVTMTFDTADNTATQVSSDYVAQSAQTLTIPASTPGTVNTTNTITIVVNGDDTDEGSALDNPDENRESFDVNLTGGSDTVNTLVFTDASGRVTITDDDDPPVVSVADVGVTEGANGATATATYTISLTPASGKVVTVDYATADSTAVSSDTDADGDPDGDSDFTAVTGSVTFTVGQNDTTVDVTVAGDDVDEADETYAFNLSNPGNATLGANAIGTITDDDASPIVSIGNQTVTEGLSGTTASTFTVSLDHESDTDITVNYATADGTAVAAGSGAAGGADYVAVSSTPLTVLAGKTSATFDVTVNGDATDEATETFTATISGEAGGVGGTGVTLGTSTGTGTITTDDTAPTISIATPASESEAGDGTMEFTVSLSNTSDSTITVDYSTADGTDADATLNAIAGSDYTSQTGTVTFAPGASSDAVTIAVPLTNDTTDEEDQSFTVTLTAASETGGTNGSAAIDGVNNVATGTITDEDLPPNVTISAPGVTSEGDGATMSFVFTVDLDAASEKNITMQADSADGTATAGGADPAVGDVDYTAVVAQALAFVPGDIQETVTVLVNGDTTEENDDTFSVGLTNLVNVTAGTASATATITDDDATPTISVNNAAAAAEGAQGASSTQQFTVSLSNPTALSAVTVNAATTDGAATSADPDYTAVGTTTLTFAVGETTKTVDVTVLGDDKDEGASEAYTLQLSGATYASISDGSGTGTITDDDDPPTISIDSPVAVTEGASGATNTIDFTVTLSNPSKFTVTADYTTTDGDAVSTNAGVTGDADFDADAATVSFAEEELTQTITITVNGDDVDEGASQAFTVDLSNPANGTLGTASGTGTITDDEATPTVDIGDVTVALEGAAATSQTASPTLTLSAISEFVLTADYATSDGTATVADGDYTAATGTASFAAGTTSTTVPVTVAGDDRDEVDETITVTLSNLSAELAAGDTTGVITITDDDAPPTVSVSSETLNPEGALGTPTDMTFTISLDAVSGKTITLDYATADGTATLADGDYDSASASLTFAAGQTSKSVVVTANGDDKDEDDETYTLDVSNIVNGLNTTASGTGTITDDDAAPTVSIGNATKTETQAATTVNVTVSLSGPSGKSITIDYTTADGTATAADGDYTAAGPTTLTFTAGQTSKTVALTIGGDTKDEDNETFDVNLSNEVNVTILDGIGTVTINDNDAPPTVSTADVSVAEGTSGATATATVTATLSEVSGKAITIQADTSDGTATTADADYTAITAGSISIAAGSLTGTADVSVTGDITDEGTSEALTLTLSNGTNVTIDSGADNGNASGADNVATVTITDDDDPPVISVTDISVTEGDSATATGTLTVNFTNPSAFQVDVDYATADGSATTADSDYTAVAATTLSFAAGATSQTITVDATGDTTDEVDEAFTVTLSNPVNGTLDTNDDLGNAAAADNVATVTITNDDTPPSISISDPTAADEDTAGSVAFTVALSNASSSDVTVSYATADGTATSTGASAAGGSDYTATSGTLTIPAGSTTDAVTVAVPIAVDTTDESDETLTVTLASPGGGSSGTPTLDGVTNTPGNSSASGSVATLTITDDDIAPLAQVADISVTEDDAISATGTLTVALSNTSDQTVTVDYATANGTALTAGDDYTTAGGSVTFAAGTSSATFDVTVRGDLKDEDDETFTAALSNPVNATLDGGTDLANASGVNSTATVTILDNDPLPAVAISNPATQGEPSTPTPVNFAVTLSAVSGRAVTVDYTTVDGTAEDAAGDGDYDAAAGTLTFAEGQTSLSIPVTVNGDSKDEDDETFSVTLSNPTNSTVATAIGAYTISDNDPQPSLTVDSPSIVEDDAGGVVTFTATLDAASGRDITIDYATADATAVAPGDYTATSGTLTFAAGATSQTFDVTVIADTTDEDDETVTVTLSNPSNVQLVSTTATATITNDDTAPSLSIGDITVTEGSSQDAVSPTTASFVFTLDAVSGKDVTVTYATADATATTADGDYTASSGTLTLAAGVLTDSVDVSVSADYDDEPDETFVLSISAVTNATASVMSATATIADDDEPPLTVTAPTSASAGQDVTFSAEIVLPISNVTSASLFFAEGGTSSFTEFALTNTTGATWTATVPGASINMRGLVWYVQVTDDLDGGRTFDENTFGAPGYVAVNGSQDLSLATMTASPNVWNAVAPPVSPDSTTMSSTFDSADGGFITEWFAWRWDATSQQWEAAESLGDSTPVANDGFETGKGWFVAVIGDGTSETRSIAGQSVDPTARYALPLASGWNLLANPFNFPVAWSDSTIRATVGNSERSPTDHLLNNNAAVDNRLIYLDTGSQTLVTRVSSETSAPYSVPAGQAFWFLSNQSGELLIPATAAPGSPSTPAPAAVKPKGDWRVFVNATSEFGSDRAEAIAARNMDSAGAGSLSYVKAPNFPGSKAPRVALVNPDVDGAMARLNTDVQSVGDELVWLVDVTNGDGAVLSWQTVDVPADYDLHLVDMTSERTIDLRRDGQVRLEGGGFNSRQYALKAVKRYIPEVTRLLPNYPNPFNPETWIPFELAEESEVAITIYGMGGEVVRRLELGRMREGAYVTREQSAHWDGRNDLGERVASAVYVYEIKAGDYLERRRLVVLK